MFKYSVILLLIYFNINYSDAAFKEIAAFGNKRFYLTTERKVSTKALKCE